MITVQNNIVSLHTHIVNPQPCQLLHTASYLAASAALHNTI